MSEGTNIYEQISLTSVSLEDAQAIADINDMMIQLDSTEALHQNSVFAVIRKTIGENEAVNYCQIVHQQLINSSIDEMAWKIINAGGWEDHAKFTIEQNQTKQFESVIDILKRIDKTARETADYTSDLLLNGQKNHNKLRLEAEAANERIFKRLATVRKPSAETVQKIQKSLQATRIDKAQQWVEQNKPDYQNAIRLATGVITKSKRQDETTKEVRAQAKEFVDQQIQQGVFGTKLTQVIFKQRTAWAKESNLPKPTLEQVIPTSIKRKVAQIKAAERKSAGSELNVAKQSMADNIARITVAHIAIKNGADSVVLRSNEKIEKAKVIEKIGNYAVMKDLETGKNFVKVATQNGKKLDIRKGDEIRSGIVFRKGVAIKQGQQEKPSTPKKDDGKSR